MLMPLIRTTQAINRLSENILVLNLHYSVDRQTYLLQQTSKDNQCVSRFVASCCKFIHKASVCSDQKTSFRIWPNQNIGITQENFIIGTFCCLAGRSSREGPNRDFYDLSGEITCTNGSSPSKVPRSDTVECSI